MTTERKNIEVVAAIIAKEGRMLATQRSSGEWKDYWEFPGGKVEPGETNEGALRREIHEELDTDIIVGRQLTTIEYDYPYFHLKMHCYLCRILSGHPTLLEHEAACWLSLDELNNVRWLPADELILPLIDESCIKD